MTPTRPRQCVVALLGWLLAITLISSTAHAQPGDWQAWLYNAADGVLLRLDATGQPLQTLPLPLPPGGTAPLSVTIDPAGRVALYATNVPAQPFALLDLATGAPVPLPSLTYAAYATSLVAGPSTLTPFALDAGVVAVGYSAEVPNPAQAARLALLPTTPGSPLRDVAVADLLPAADPATVPLPLDVDASGTRVLFVLVGTFGYLSTFDTAYVWDAAANTVTPTGAPTSLDRTVCNGVWLAALPDLTLPNSAADFLVPQANALVAETPAVLPSVVFSTAAFSLFWPRCVANGAYLLVGGYAADNRLAWFLLGQQGQPDATFPPVQMSAVLGTPDGFAFTSDAGGRTVLAHIDLRAGWPHDAAPPPPLWTAPEGQAYTLVWAGVPPVR